MSRVLFLATSRSDGGIESHSVRLAAALRKRGQPLTYACRPGAFVEARCRAAAVPTRPFRVRNSGDLGAVLRLSALLRRERIDILHVHSRRDFLPALLGVSLARMRTGGQGPRLVLHAHLVRPLGGRGRLNGWLWARGADTVIAVSEAVRARLESEHGFPPGFVRVLSNGVDVESFSQPGESAALASRRFLREEWGISAEAPVIGMIGRLDAKGQERMLRCLPTLASSVPNLRLVLVGAEGRPDEQARLTALAQEYGVAENLVFTGARNDIPAVLTVFDVLAHLPTDEAFGLALVEAMAAGLPTVATDLGGCREIVRNGVTGLLVPPDGDEALTAALLGLLAGPEAPSRRAQFGTAGRAVAAREFSLDTQIEHLQTLYRELTRLRRAGVFRCRDARPSG